MHYRNFFLFILLSIGSTSSSFAQDKWPVAIVSKGYTISVYQPQPDSYSGTDLTARAAVSIAPPDGGDVIFGAIWTKATLEIDRDSRMATITNMTVTDAKFPSVTDEAKITALKTLLATELPGQVEPFSIDRLIASLDQEQGGGAKPDYKNDAPHVFFAVQPTNLVLIDGEPKFQSIDKTNYELVVNTPYFIARGTGKSTFYMSGSNIWFESTAIQGPWSVSNSAPADLQQMIPPDTTVAAAKKDADGKPMVPKIIVSTVPAELVQTDGKPALQPIKGTQLLYVTNTEDDIFMDIASQQYYILVSGRWYKGAKLEDNAWSFVAGEQLPADFAKIPAGSKKEDVLASVPGTQAAKEAVLDATIPQTATVDLKSTTSTITYDGDPKWKLIEGTAIYEAEKHRPRCCTYVSIIMRARTRSGMRAHKRSVRGKSVRKYHRKCRTYHQAVRATT